jgi:hypothetical protein
MTSLFLLDVSLHFTEFLSRTATSSPLIARALAHAKPTIPAPTTTHCTRVSMTFSIHQKMAFRHLEYGCPRSGEYIILVAKRRLNDE